MSDSEKGRARAVADVAEGLVLASVEIAAPAKRVFCALSSEEVIHWWVRSGVFDTRKWNGDVLIGGRWSASGVAMGNPSRVLRKSVRKQFPKIRLGIRA